MSVCMDLALFNRVIVEAPTAKVQRYRKIAGEARHHASPQRFKKSVLVSRSGCSRMLIWRYYSQFYTLRAMLGPMVHRYRVTHHLSFPSPCAVSFQCHLLPWFISVFCSLQDSILLQKMEGARRHPMDPKATTHGVISSMTWNFLLVLYLKGIFCELEPSTRPLQRQQHYKAGHRCFNILYKRYQSTSKEAIRHTHTCPIIKSQHKADCIPKESITQYAYC